MPGDAPLNRGVVFQRDGVYRSLPKVDPEIGVALAVGRVVKQGIHHREEAFNLIVSEQAAVMNDPWGTTSGA